MPRGGDGGGLQGSERVEKDGEHAKPGEPTPRQQGGEAPQRGAPGAVEVKHSTPPGDRTEPVNRRTIVRRWALFVLFGLVLYFALYAGSEWLVYRHGEKNRFYRISTTPPQHFDYVILGASHAMPLDFENMNEVLEAKTGTRIMNLSIEGGGPLPGRLLLDYFLTRHTADNVVWFLDSFAFYSPQWNEDRLDPSMFQRAPLDAGLVRTLWRYPWARDMVPPYLSGIAKINNHGRFDPDVPDSEVERFQRTYRPVPQIDRQRIDFLYPDEIDPAVRARYLAEFEDLIAYVRGRGMDMVVIEPPTPPRYRENLPGEDEFGEIVGDLLAEAGVTYRDFSETVTGDKFFYDTDHLNRAGVEVFIEGHLAEFLAEQSASR